MTDDVKCPYCGQEIEIYHDPERGYDEGKLYQDFCDNCSKNFVYSIFIITNFEAHKADCLNDKDHEYEPTQTFPKEFVQMRCKICGDERNPTVEEMDEILSIKC